MGEIEKIITDQIQATSAKADGLMKALFGKAFEETGEMIADQVRLRRFKNQVKIFEKAKEFLKGEKLDPQKVNLKVLAPLLEFSSYEEDEELQERWAYLIKNIVSKPFSVLLQQHAIEILNKISNEEVKIIDYIYEELNKEYKKRTTWSDSIDFNSLIESYTVDINLISEKTQINNSELIISNLVALGIIRYEMEVNVPHETIPFLHTKASVYDYKSIKLTKLGYTFIEICKK